MRHELNPKRGEDVEKRRFLVIAVRFDIIVRQSRSPTLQIGV